MIRLGVGALALTALLTGCQQPKPAPVKGADAAITVAESTCPDDGPRLALTNICQGRVSPYFSEAASNPIPAPRADCMWIGQEVKSPDPNEALLLMAARCGDTTSSLEFSAGARSASLAVAVSAVHGPSRKGQELARVFLVGDQDAKKMILDMARQTTANKGEAAACAVRSVNASDTHMPPDAFVVDVSDAYKTANSLGQKAGETGQYAVCGQWGYNSGANAYWMVRGGYAVFVNNGKDPPDFDFGTLMVMRRGGEGQAFEAVE